MQGRLGRWAVPALVAVALGTAVLVVVDREPPDGTFTMQEAPDELPVAAVLPGARDVEGTVARQGPSISAAVTYLVEVELDQAVDGIVEGLEAAGWTLRTRSADDTGAQAVLDGEESAVLTITARPSTAATAVAVVLAG